MHRDRLPAGDDRLVQIVDEALLRTARESGAWLACRPGCAQCCIGPFPINRLDAARLRRGLVDLQKFSPERAARVRQRASDSVARLSPDFPGNPQTGVLDENPDAEKRFVQFANDEPCPALDMTTGLCELYEARPMTCRVFGPPVRSEEGLGVCELCYRGATDKQIAACEMIPDPDGLEFKLLQQIEGASGAQGSTIVAFCLAGS
jgi:Fe-S-cluster containining protein